MAFEWYKTISLQSRLCSLHFNQSEEALPGMEMSLKPLIFWSIFL